MKQQVTTMTDDDEMLFQTFKRGPLQDWSYRGDRWRQADAICSSLLDDGARSISPGCAEATVAAISS